MLLVFYCFLLVGLFVLLVEIPTKLANVGLLCILLPNVVLVGVSRVYRHVVYLMISLFSIEMGSDQAGLRTECDLYH